MALQLLRLAVNYISPILYVFCLSLLNHNKSLPNIETFLFGPQQSLTSILLVHQHRHIPRNKLCGAHPQHAKDALVGRLLL